MHAFARTPSELFEQVTRGWSALEPFRKAYALFHDEYLGANAGYDVKGVRVTNLIYESVEEWRTGLSPDKIRHKITAKSPPQRFDAEKIGLVLDAEAAECKLAETYAEAGLEGLFAPLVVMRIGQQIGPRTVEVDGEPLSKTEATVDLVCLEDLSLDVDAKSWAKKRWVADRVEISRAAAISEKVFGRAPEEYMQPMPNGQNPEPAPDGIEVMTRDEAVEFLEEQSAASKRRSTVDDPKVTRKGANAASGESDDDDTLQLWHVAIYDGDCVYIAYIADADSQPEKFLLFEKHRQHPKGPYVSLKFGGPRNNILGMPALAAIYDQHDAMRQLTNKVVDQLMKLQVVLAYGDGASDDAMRVKRSSGDRPVRVKDVKQLATITWGGVPADWYQGREMIAQEFGNVGGNVRMQSGASQEGDTASQSMQLQNNANKRKRRMQRSMRNMGGEVAEIMTYQAVFNEPVGRHVVDYPLGPGLSVPVELSPSEMNADALAFQYSIEPFYYVGEDPLTQRQNVLMFIDLYVSKLLPAVMQGALRPEAVAEIGRVEFGIENIDDLIGDLGGMLRTQAAMQMQASQQPVQVGPGQPAMRPAQGGGGGNQKPTPASAGANGTMGAARSAGQSARPAMAV